MRTTVFPCALALFCLAVSGQAANWPRITQAIDESRLHTLNANIHPLAKRRFDRGTAPGDLPMERMLVLNRSGEQQLWVLAPIQSYNIVSSRSSDMLDVRNGSPNVGATIQQSVPTGGRQQQWQFIPTGVGYYTILNHLTGKVLDVTGASPNVGALIQQAIPNGAQQQQWQLVPTAGGYYQIVNDQQSIGCDRRVQ